MNADQRKKKAHDLRKLSKPVAKARTRYRRAWSDWVDAPDPAKFDIVLAAMAARIGAVRTFLHRADKITGSHR